MSDPELVEFLQWALPKLGRRWAGYRKVRRQVRRRLTHRLQELGLGSLTEYRCYLESAPGEWRTLDAMANITISRFYRDRAVYDFLLKTVLPTLIDHALNADRPTIRVWSAGCASGEEPYTLSIMWQLRLAHLAQGIQMEIVGTDIRPLVLERARIAQYSTSAMKDLPASWREKAFESAGDELVLLPRFRSNVEFIQHDIRQGPPAGLFDLAMCRYLSFTYFDDAGQRETTRTLARAVRPQGALTLGSKEDLPPDEPGFQDWAPPLRIYKRSTY